MDLFLEPHTLMIKNYYYCLFNLDIVVFLCRTETETAIGQNQVKCKQISERSTRCKTISTVC